MRTPGSPVPLTERSAALIDFLKRQSVGSFWLPLYLSIWAGAPTQKWANSHVVAAVSLSVAAQVLYAFAAAQLGAPLTRRTRLAPTAAPDSLRVAAGLCRWVAMPLVVLHALFAPSSGAGDNMGPLFDCAALVRRLAGARLLAALDGLRATGAFPGHLLPLSAPAPYLLVAFAFLAFRTLQVALWLIATPPPPVRVAPSGLAGDAASAAAVAAPHLFPGGEFNAARYGQLRVLIIGDSVPPKVDGVAIRVGHLVRQLQAAGHCAHIVTSIRSRDEPLYGAQVTQLPGYVSRWYLEHSMTIPTPALLLAFLRFRPHVVHIMDEGFMAAIATACASLCLTPMVFSHHSHIDRFLVAYMPWLGTLNLATHLTQVLRRIFAAQSDVHLAVGHEMQASLEHAGCGPHIGQWACGVDVETFSPARRCTDMTEGSLRWRLTGGRPHLPIVVYCGRVAAEKRLELISVMARHLVRLIRSRKRDGAPPRRPPAPSALGSPARADGESAAAIIDERAAAILLEVNYGRAVVRAGSEDGAASPWDSALPESPCGLSRSSLSSLGSDAEAEGVGAGAGSGAGAGMLADVEEAAWEREPVVAVVIVGKGPMLEPLKAWLSELGPSHNVDLTKPYPGVAHESNAEICQGAGGRGIDAAGSADAFPGLAGLHEAASRGGDADEAVDAGTDESEADAAADAAAPTLRRRGTSVSSAASSTRSTSSANGIVSVFCGQLNHGATLGSVYATADAFFSPSAVETLGQVFQEAMSAGTVPIGAGASGVLEVMTHGREGYHFAPGDLREAAAYVLRAFDDRATAPPGDAYAGATAGTGAARTVAGALATEGSVAPLRAKHISECGRDRVLSKSWGTAFEQAMAAYTRSCLTRWHLGKAHG
jgi:glycosyltransferase involved in cell wall biosynthesis